MRRVVEVHHIKLLDEYSHNEFVPQLGKWVEGDNWVIIQHSYLLGNAHQILQELAQVCVLFPNCMCTVEMNFTHTLYIAS